MPSAGGPRLVYDATAPVRTSAAPPREPASRRARIAFVGLLLLLSVAAALFEYHRATELEARVGELTSSLAGARAEIAARRQHLDAIRASVADVRERVGALESLAGADPAAPPAAAEPAPNH